MAKMHENELAISETIVHSLIKSQCPSWANLPLKAIPSSGTDHALFCLGREYVVRLPRIHWAIESIIKEYDWVPKIAKFLRIPVAEPLFKGNPNLSYPWAWTVSKWHEGHNPSFEHKNEYELLAKDLAYFLNELHGIKLTNGPHSRRGIPLKEQDVETRKAIEELEGEIDVQYVTFLWNQLSHVPSWNKQPVWVHGDFLPGNILVQNNRLSAVIDFSDVGIGDPACDLIIAWSLLNPHSRRCFRQCIHLKCS